MKIFSRFTSREIKEALIAGVFVAICITAMVIL